MNSYIDYDTGPDNDSTEYPWCIIEDGGVSNRFATKAEAEVVMNEETHQ